MDMDSDITGVTVWLTPFKYYQESFPVGTRHLWVKQAEISSQVHQDKLKGRLFKIESSWSNRLPFLFFDPIKHWISVIFCILRRGPLKCDWLSCSISVYG